LVRSSHENEAAAADDDDEENEEAFRFANEAFTFRSNLNRSLVRKGTFRRIMRTLC